MNVAFVNGGILGLTSFRHLAAPDIRGRFRDPRRHFVLTEDLSLLERVHAPAPLPADLAGSPGHGEPRPRALPPGTTTPGCRRAAGSWRRGLEHFDVLHFHRQATAYAQPRSDGEAAVHRVASTARRPASCRTRPAPLERGSLQFNVGATARCCAGPRQSSPRRAGRRTRSRGCTRTAATPVHVMPNPVTAGAVRPRRG